MASPHYGERWARHWLDYSRYADTKGYVFTEDRKYPFAYKYRDWVVRALNEDLPYDEFLIRQIAADRLPTASDPGTLAALGFLVLGRRFLNVKPDIIDDRLDVLCRTTLGLTVTCARCHDHKFDPISTKDYYALYGVLDSTIEPKEPADVMALADGPEPHNVRVFIRGNPGNQGDEAPRRFLSCLAGPDSPPFSQGSGRLELAQAIANRDNPLTARVLVNRVWLQYFGTGLVRTPSDFGLRSEPPTHPELLDFLSRQLMDNGWSLKHLHRLIVLSGTYRQASGAANAERERTGRRARSRQSAALAAEPPPAGLGVAARRAAGRGRLAGPDRRRTGGRFAGRAVHAPANHLRSGRAAKPAGHVSHVRLRRARHAQSAAVRHHGPAAGAVSDERPVRGRASTIAGRRHRRRCELSAPGAARDDSIAARWADRPIPAN